MITTDGRGYRLIEDVEDLSVTLVVKKSESCYFGCFDFARNAWWLARTLRI